MDEIEAEIPIVITQEDPVFRLRRLLRGPKLIKLVDLLEGVIDDTGYGELKIVVAQGRVQNLKAEKSYQ
jgi:hypothetical protein